MSKNDVWRELEERLKQKAKSYLEITLEIAKEVDVAKAEEGKEPKVKEPKWVRLEDVQKLIEEIKQKYVLVSKEKLEEIYKNLEIDKISGYYVNLEFFRMIEELLRKNDEKSC